MYFPQFEQNLIFERQRTWKEEGEAYADIEYKH